MQSSKCSGQHHTWSLCQWTEKQTLTTQTACWSWIRLILTNKGLKQNISLICDKAYSGANKIIVIELGIRPQPALERSLYFALYSNASLLYFWAHLIKRPAGWAQKMSPNYSYISRNVLSTPKCRFRSCYAQLKSANSTRQIWKGKIV